MMLFNIDYNLAIFVVRVLVGVTFTLHGAQKVFGLFGGSGLEGFASFAASTGAPKLLGYAAALFELAGGIMLTLGIAAEFGALLEIPVMLGALVLVHGSKGFFIQSGGYEYALNLLILCVVIVIAGPGKWFLWNPFVR